MSTSTNTKIKIISSKESKNKKIRKISTNFLETEIFAKSPSSLSIKKSHKCWGVIG